MKAMHSGRKKWFRFLSFALIACGAFLLGRGAREIIESHTGQWRAQHQFNQSNQTKRSPQPQIEPPLGEPVAKLSIPRLGASVYVVQGDDSKDLRLGPGHIPGTAMPGAKGNCVIAGHRDTHFRVLKDIRQGDDIVLETSRGRFVYTVDQTDIVKPTNVSSLQPARSGVLHLITCYPFYYLGHAPKRFVVTAKLEQPLSASAAAGY
jgi:sortase A